MVKADHVLRGEKSCLALNSNAFGFANRNTANAIVRITCNSLMLAAIRAHRFTFVAAGQDQVEAQTLSEVEIAP